MNDFPVKPIDDRSIDSSTLLALEQSDIVDASLGLGATGDLNSALESDVFEHGLVLYAGSNAVPGDL
jgi:hypothetical protein